MSKEEMPTSRTTTNFTWVINNFSKLDTHFSDVFIAAGYKWRLLLFAKGRNVDSLAVYLHAPGSAKLPSGWNINAQLSLTVVNQILNKDSINKCDKCKFSAAQTYWGYPDVLPITELYDPSKGYLFNDTVIIETHVLLNSSSLDSKKEIDARRIASLPIPQLPDTTQSVSLASSSMARQSSSTLLALEKSKNLLRELFSLKITRNSTSASTSGISESSLLPLRPLALQLQWKILKDYYLALSLEAIDRANAFDDIEKNTSLLLLHSASSLERAILTDLVSRLAAFREIVPAAKLSIENLRAEKVSLSWKKADVRSRLYHGQEQLSSLEVKFSKLLEEERELLGVQVIHITARKEKLLTRKNSVVIELEKINEQVSKDLEEWRDISKGTEQAANNWIQAREKLAQANLSWKLCKQNLELCEKLSGKTVYEDEEKTLQTRSIISNSKTIRGFSFHFLYAYERSP